MGPYPFEFLDYTIETLVGSGSNMYWTAKYSFHAPFVGLAVASRLSVTSNNEENFHSFLTNSYSNTAFIQPDVHGYVVG